MQIVSGKYLGWLGFKSSDHEFSLCGSPFMYVCLTVLKSWVSSVLKNDTLGSYICILHDTGKVLQVCQMIQDKSLFTIGFDRITEHYNLFYYYPTQVTVYGPI